MNFLLQWGGRSNPNIIFVTFFKIRFEGFPKAYVEGETLFQGLHNTQKWWFLVAIFNAPVWGGTQLLNFALTFFVFYFGDHRGF